jgi:ABC-type multidrug transport system fused ATPase/permease subunit
MKIPKRFRDSLLIRSLTIFSKLDRQKLLAVAVIQVFLGFLDLLGVAFIGLLGALTVNGIQSQKPHGRIESILKVIHIETYSFQSQVAILGIIATGIFVFRTASSIYFTKKILKFLSMKTATTSSKLVSKLLNLPPLELQENTTQQLIYAIGNGVNNITVGIIGTCITLLADTSIFLILSSSLFFVDPLMALISMLLFSGTAYLLYLQLQVHARTLGARSTDLTIQNNQRIMEVLTSYRETIVRGRRHYYINEISGFRSELATITADQAFLPNISKYVLETILVVGTLSICAVQFLTKDAMHAISVLTVFLAAGSRIAPAVLRVQQGAINIRSNIGSSAQTLSLIEGLDWEDKEPNAISPMPTFFYPDFDPKIEIKSLKVTYPGNNKPTIQELDLTVQAGEIVAIVGPSGAGKTTLVDTILGLIEPAQGSVSIDQMKPLEVIQSYPGAISYVPQNVSIIEGTIADNITLGYPSDSVNQDQIRKAITIAQLEEFINSLPHGLNTQVGEFGSKMSGGQRQRLGIARAIYSNPKLLILDEATSALDSITEEKFGLTLKSLKGQTTVILIAHRLSTVRQSQRVIYLDKGGIIAQGSFDYVSQAVPDFNRSANILDATNS